MKRSKNHYAVIRQVIEHIVEHKLYPLSLDELALSLQMGKGYLQKVFTEWVGISPKQFSRYLSLQYSKELLLQNKSTVQAAVKTGLSSSGRLHDLFVDIEAMTPGEYKELGATLVIYYSIFETKFGLCLVASTHRGICNVLFFDTKEEARADLLLRWPKSKIVHKSMPEHKQIEEYFNGIGSVGNKKKGSKIKLHLYGTNFQIKVWEALLIIPEGYISTYGNIAALIGSPMLSRAVGAAIGDNPIGYIIPCHRVLKSTGEISGYRWGIERKRVMLGWEAVRKNRDT